MAPELQITNKMFLIDPEKTWYESIASYYGWIVGFVLALLTIWRATKKTTTTGRSFFTAIKRFTDTGAALKTLNDTVQNGFDEIKAEQAYLNAKLEVLSDGHVTPTFRADELGNFLDVNKRFVSFFIKVSTSLKATAGLRFSPATTAPNH